MRCKSCTLSSIKTERLVRKEWNRQISQLQLVLRQLIQEVSFQVCVPLEPPVKKKRKPKKRMSKVRRKAQCLVTSMLLAEELFFPEREKLRRRYSFKYKGLNYENQQIVYHVAK